MDLMEKRRMEKHEDADEESEGAQHNPDFFSRHVFH
jgi:hypothetical protein